MPILPTMQLDCWLFSQIFSCVRLAAANVASCKLPHLHVFSKPVVFIPTQLCLNDITRQTSSSFIWSHKKLYTAASFFFLTYAVVFLKTKQTLMCQIRPPLPHILTVYIYHILNLLGILNCISTLAGVHKQSVAHQMTSLTFTWDKMSEVHMR